MVRSGDFVSAEKRTTFAGFEVLSCFHAAPWDAIRKSFSEGKLAESGIGRFAEGIVGWRWLVCCGGCGGDDRR
jgi:hypothetical protein